MSEYNIALLETEKYLEHPVGFSNYESPKEDSKVIIRQNNTIIQLLIKILNKINTEDNNKEIILASSGIITPTRAINSEKWIYLKAAIEKISHPNL